MFIKFFAMIEFELQTRSIRSDRSGNWSTAIYSHLRSCSSTFVLIFLRILVKVLFKKLLLEWFELDTSVR